MTKPTKKQLFESAIAVLKRPEREYDARFKMNAAPIHPEEGCGPLDRVLKSNFQSTKPLDRSPIMARAKNNKPQSAAAAAAGASLVQEAAGKVNEAPGTIHTESDAATDVPEGYTHTHNANVPTPRAEAADKAADKAAAKAEEKAAKLAAKLAKADDKKAEIEAKKEARAAAKANREAALAALADGKAYQGSMLALAERVKSGAYVKSATGQLRSNDELAQTLDTVPPTGVITLAKALELPGDYSKLNVGQQSMNYRNRMRGAIKKGTLSIEAIKARIVELDLDAGPAIEARKAAVAKAKAEREAAAEAKKAVKPVDAPTTAE